MTDSNRSPAIVALTRALALEQAIDAACADYGKATLEGRYAFTVDAILLLADRIGLLGPARTAQLLGALAAVLTITTDLATYERAKSDLAPRAAHLLEALGERGGSR